MLQSIQIALGVVFVAFAVLEFLRWRWPHPSPPAFMPYWPSLIRIAVLMKQLDRFYDFLLDQTRKLGLVFRIHVPLYGTVYILIRPDDAHHILATNFENYVKGKVVHDNLEALFGDGIFTTDGEKWKKQRQSASHLFKKRLMNEAIRVMMSHSADVVEELRSYAESAKPFDAQQLFSAFTLDSFVEVAFGRRESTVRANKKLPFATSFDAATRMLVIRLVFPFWRWFNVTPGLEDHIQVVNKYANEIIEERQREVEANQSALDNREDVLSRFIALGEKDVVTLRDAVINFIIAGRDTTAQTLTWMAYFLALNPSLQDELVAEIEEHIQPDVTPTLDDLKQLQLVQATMDETLRLRPPVPIDIKTALKDDVLPSGVHIPGGSLVLYSPYVMGHHDQLWNRPENFDPKRWLDPNRPVPPHNAIPFQAGPRICLGMNFAYTEVKACMSTLLPKYRFVVDDSLPKPVVASGVTLSARDGVMIRVEKRKSHPNK